MTADGARHTQCEGRYYRQLARRAAYRQQVHSGYFSIEGLGGRRNLGCNGELTALHILDA
ncbi:MAG: hypothetical protein IPL32_00020 [Chloracidobacterium sp.]|nr:hypothetical protein [Chloracidobacterium sp.]